jgi:2-oxoglutarate ferredoxin oxidoreductase subunit alpha
MVESINMAFMMELPMLIILVQRLGPSTGTATAGSQGDLRLLHGIISGGYPLPVLSIADLGDCWGLPPLALQTAVDLRTPVVLLTSKEMVMTQRSVGLESLHDIQPVKRMSYHASSSYRPYAADDRETPAFLPLGSKDHQVRMTASTHDRRGILQHSSAEALANTRRLWAKVTRNTPVIYRLDEAEGATTLIVTYGITSGAASAAVEHLTLIGQPVSLLVVGTLTPVPPVYYEIIDRYSRVVFAEENLQGQFASLLFGARCPAGATLVGDIGHMVRPEQIVREVLR